MSCQQSKTSSTARRRRISGIRSLIVSIAFSTARHLKSRCHLTSCYLAICWKPERKVSMSFQCQMRCIVEATSKFGGCGMALTCCRMSRRDEVMLRSGGDQRGCEHCHEQRCMQLHATVERLGEKCHKHGSKIIIRRDDTVYSGQ